MCSGSLKLCSTAIVPSAAASVDCVCAFLFPIAQQTDEITLNTHGASGAVAVDLVSSRFSHPTLRVRELAKFMDSGAYLSAVEVCTPLIRN